MVVTDTACLWLQQQQRQHCCLVTTSQIAVYDCQCQHTGAEAALHQMLGYSSMTAPAIMASHMNPVYHRVFNKLQLKTGLCVVVSMRIQCSITLT